VGLAFPGWAGFLSLTLCFLLGPGVHWLPRGPCGGRGGLCLESLCDPNARPGVCAGLQRGFVVLGVAVSAAVDSSMICEDTWPRSAALSSSSSGCT
jgi:hypothetical protein